MNKLEAVIICVGNDCCKFLALTLSYNKKFFDHIVVVTDENDIDTEYLCKSYDVTCVKTNEFYKNGGKFRKGAGYNVGIRNLKYFDYVCFLDVDVVIPNEFQKIKETHNWSVEKFYGARRVIFPTINDWAYFENGLITENNLWVPFGIAYGFWGIFNCRSQPMVQNGFYYPENDGVGESDWRFLSQWGENTKDHKEYLGLLEELPMRVYHLSTPGGCGKERVDFWV